MFNINNKIIIATIQLSSAYAILILCFLKIGKMIVLRFFTNNRPYTVRLLLQYDRSKLPPRPSLKWLHCASTGSLYVNITLRLSSLMRLTVDVKVTFAESMCAPQVWCRHWLCNINRARFPLSFFYVVKMHNIVRCYYLCTVFYAKKKNKTI